MSALDVVELAGILGGLVYGVAQARNGSKAARAWWERRKADRARRLREAADTDPGKRLP